MDSGEAELKGRKRLLDSDDEAEMRAASSQDVGHACVQSSPRETQSSKAKRGEFLNREVQGMQLTFTVLKGPRVLVPTEGPSLNLIVEYLGGKKGEAKGNGKKGGDGKETNGDAKSTPPDPSSKRSQRKAALAKAKAGERHW